MSPRRNVHRRTNSTGSNPDGAPAEAAVELPPPPSLDQAKAYARSLLLRQAEGNDRPGELFPLYTALRNFDRLGTDISQYMHFMYWGARLEHRMETRAGDLVYIPAGMAHLPFNPGTVDAVAVIARTDPHEQESVRLLPELDALVPRA